MVFRVWGIGFRSSSFRSQISNSGCRVRQAPGEGDRCSGLVWPPEATRPTPSPTPDREGPLWVVGSTAATIAVVGRTAAPMDPGLVAPGMKGPVGPMLIGYDPGRAGAGSGPPEVCPARSGRRGGASLHHVVDEQGRLGLIRSTGTRAQMIWYLSMDMDFQVRCQQRRRERNAKRESFLNWNSGVVYCEMQVRPVERTWHIQDSHKR